MRAIGRGRREAVPRRLRFLGRAEEPVPHDGIASPDRRDADAGCSDYALRGSGWRWVRFGRLLLLAGVSGPSFSTRVAIRDEAAWGSSDTGSLAASVAREGLSGGGEVVPPQPCFLGRGRFSVGLIQP